MECLLLLLRFPPQGVASISFCIAGTLVISSSSGTSYISHMLVLAGISDTYEEYDDIKQLHEEAAAGIWYTRFDRWATCIFCLMVFYELWQFGYHLHKYLMILHLHQQVSLAISGLLAIQEFLYLLRYHTEMSLCCFYHVD